MAGDESLEELLQRLRAGDEHAATAIFRRYAHRLVGLASHKLTGVLRQKVDSEDLVQSAFKSFFRADAESPFALEDWDELWALLATITLRKCGHQVRHFLTAKRDVRLERGVADRGEDSGAGWVAMARDPTPFEAAVLSDTIDLFLKDLDDKPRQVVELTLQGLTPEEIAPRVGLSERSVYRQLERFKENLRSARDRDEPAAHPQQDQA